MVKVSICLLASLLSLEVRGKGLFSQKGQGKHIFFRKKVWENLYFLGKSKRILS